MIFERFCTKPEVKTLQAPDRILDAPELLDDYYLNLLDWSSRNVVAVALGSTVYLWDAGSGSIQQLLDVGGEETDDQSNYVTSVSWAGDGKHLAVGLGSSEVQLWDCEAIRQVGKGSLNFSDSLLPPRIVLEHDFECMSRWDRRWLVVGLGRSEVQMWGCEAIRQGLVLASIG
jgi:WD40 repeat protein